MHIDFALVVMILQSSPPPLNHFEERNDYKSRGMKRLQEPKRWRAYNHPIYLEEPRLEDNKDKESLVLVERL